MEPGELQALLAKVGVLLENSEEDPVSFTKIVDPVTLKTNKKIYNRATVKELVARKMGDPLRASEGPLQAEDMITVFSAINVALVFIRNIASNNPQMFENEEGAIFLKKLQEHLAPLSDEAIFFAEQYLHALQAEMPSQSLAGSHKKDVQDEIKNLDKIRNLLEGLSYTLKDITTPSNEEGPLSLFFVGTEARRKMQKEPSEQQKYETSDTEEEPGDPLTPAEVREQLGLEAERPLPELLSEELSPDKAAACFLGLKKCCDNHSNPRPRSLGALLFSVSGNSKLIADLKRFIDDPSLIALHRGHFFNIVDKMADKGLIDQKLLIALVDYRINRDPVLDAAVVRIFSNLDKRPVLEDLLDTIVNPNTRRSRVQ